MSELCTEKFSEIWVNKNFRQMASGMEQTAGSSEIPRLFIFVKHHKQNR